MNQSNLLNADLHEETAVEETAVEETAVEETAVEETAVEETAVEETAVEETAVEETAVEETAVEETAVEETVPVQEQPTPTNKVRSGAGRKVDTTGKTALGAARILYAQNPNLGTKELRALFVKELGPKFNMSEQVAQTYVSLVRKVKKST